MTYISALSSLNRAYTQIKDGKSNISSPIPFNQLSSDVIEKNQQDSAMSSAKTTESKLNPLDLYNQNKSMTFPNFESCKAIRLQSDIPDSQPEAYDKYDAGSYFAYLNRAPGIPVLDLTRLSSQLENKIAFPQAEAFKDDWGVTNLRLYFEAPNSNKLTRVEISLDNPIDSPVEGSELEPSIKKAIRLVDKFLSLRYEMVGDASGCLGLDLPCNGCSSTFDFKEFTDTLSDLLRLAKHSDESGNCSESMLQSKLEELKDFVLKIGC